VAFSTVWQSWDLPLLGIHNCLESHIEVWKSFQLWVLNTGVNNTQFMRTPRHDDANNRHCNEAGINRNHGSGWRQMAAFINHQAATTSIEPIHVPVHDRIRKNTSNSEAVPAAPEVTFWQGGVDHWLWAALDAHQGAWASCLWQRSKVFEL